MAKLTAKEKQELFEKFMIEIWEWFYEWGQLTIKNNPHVDKSDLTSKFNDYCKAHEKWNTTVLRRSW